MTAVSTSGREKQLAGSTPALDHAVRLLAAAVAGTALMRALQYAHSSAIYYIITIACYLAPSEGTSDNLGQTSLPRHHFSDVPTEAFAPLLHAVIAEITIVFVESCLG